MKILYLHGTGIYFGGDKEGDIQNSIVSVASMCEGFTANGHSVALAVPGKEEDRTKAVSFVDSIFEQGFHCRLMFLPLEVASGAIKKLFPSRTIKDVLEVEKPDLVVTRIVSWATASVECGIPVIFDAHSARLHTKSFLIDQILRRKLVRCSRQESFRKLVGISNRLTAFFEGEGVPAEKLQALHNGFDAQPYRSDISKQLAREKLGLSQERNLVVYCGSLHGVRGIDLIIPIAEKIPDVDFLIVGGPEKDRRMYSAEASTLGLRNIEFRRTVNKSEVPLYLFSADILLALFSKKIPTIEFCSPLKIIEYMGAGRPVLTQAFPSIMELIQDGVTGYLAQPESALSVVEGIRRILGDPDRDAVAQNARDVVFSENDWPVRARRFLHGVEF